MSKGTGHKLINNSFWDSVGGFVQYCGDATTGYNLILAQQGYPTFCAGHPALDTIVSPQGIKAAANGFYLPDGSLLKKSTGSSHTIDFPAASGTAGQPLLSGGAGAQQTWGTVQGNQTKFVSYAGSAPATDDCAKFDASGNLTTAGAACGGGSGGTTNQNYRDIVLAWDCGGSACSGTITRCREVSFGGTINQFSLVADASNSTGTVTVGVASLASYASTGPAAAADISNGGETMTTAYRLQDSTLTGWTTALTAGSVVCGTLSSPANGTWYQATVRVSAN
jgi:hypothetical protein